MCTKIFADHRLIRCPAKFCPRLIRFRYGISHAITIELIHHYLRCCAFCFNNCINFLCYWAIACRIVLTLPSAPLIVEFFCSLTRSISVIYETLVSKYIQLAHKLFSSVLPLSAAKIPASP